MSKAALSEAQTISPDIDQLVERARSLVPALQQRQEQTETQRRVPQESISEIVDAGLFKILQPQRYGGFEHGFDAYVRAVIEIGSGCGSTGWVYSVLLLHQWMLGMFTPQAQDDVWKDTPHALAASSYRPSGEAVIEEGGYRVNGKWTFCSGCDNVEWLILGASISGGEGEDTKGQGFVLVPKEDVEIEDEWHVIGLAGTGSNSVVLKNVFVPSHRMLNIADATSGNPPGSEVNPAILYKVPLFSVISLSLCAPALGIGQGVLNEFVETTRQRKTVGGIQKTPKTMADLPTIQLRVAEAACGMDAAKQLVIRDCQELLSAAAGGTLTELQRASNKADLSFAVTLATRSVDQLFKATGGHGLTLSNRIQRAWRDIAAASMHISLNWDNSGAIYGRVLLGRPPESMQF